jgi:Diiron non-heme beta-hydroxylase N-terminal domain/Beta-lactamase superfamily domain
VSQEPLYRLNKSTVAEPLVNRWAAWAHVMSPVPASLHLLNYQLKMLDSYLSDPQIHEEACQKPKLRSGAFVNVGKERAPEVRDFLARTREALADNLKLARDVLDFQTNLTREAKGQSLEPYYARVPESFRGYVELVYDYYNHPIVRFIESMFYESPYHKKGLQSIRLFRNTSDADYLFFQNTPRLPEPDQIEWAVPFDDERVDELFRLDYAPRPLAEIRDLLGLQPSDDERLLPLLTEEPAPPPPARWEGSAARVRTLGHAGVLVEWNGTSILVDPYVSVIPGDGGIDRISFHDLPERIDYVLITHLHQDHFCLETLLRLRHKIDCLVVPRASGMFYGDISLKLLARSIGFKRVLELDALETIRFPGGEIKGIPFMGEHADLPHSKTAYLVRAAGEQILFGADSDCLDRRVYQNLRRILGTVETVFIGMECVGAPLSWACGPLLPFKSEYKHDQSRRYKGCDATRALNILEGVGAKRVYLYAMGLEPWMEHLLGLAYADDSPQIKESKKLLAVARQKKFAAAELVFGKMEILLGGDHPQGVPAPPPNPLAARPDAEIGDPVY